MRTLGEIGEDTVVGSIVGFLEQGDAVVVGPGDDCAVVDVGNGQTYQLLKTDCLVEGIHYEAGADPRRVGWKAVARVVSDFAAMGGRPGHLLVTIAMSPPTTEEYVAGLYAGMQRCAVAYGADICGGETSSVPAGSAALVSVAGTGSVGKKRYVTRAGGVCGDAVLVTGSLGGSISGKHLDFMPRVEEAQWLAGNYDIHAMMDLSDGVARDLPRLAKASRCGYVLTPDAVPVTEGCGLDQALGDGEDYELLLTVDPGDVDDLLGAWRQRFPGLPLTRIGSLCRRGQGDDLGDGGWQHFSS